MSERMAIKGNEAISETAIRCGLDFFAGYPITPQTEMLEYISRRLPQEGKVFVQAESEIASSNMILGAAIGGARAMTATSGPGLALMAEVLCNFGIGRLPVVLVDVQRAFNTISPCQSDYNFLVKGLGHGGTRAFVTAPMNVQEAVDCTELSFEKAWEYCVPAILLIDGMLGQTTEGVVLPEKKTELPPPKYAVPTGRGNKAQRTFQLFNGNYRGLFGEDATEACLVDNNRMYREWVKTEARSASYRMEDAEYAIFAYGSCARICLDVVDELRAEGYAVGMFRPITLFPFPELQIQAIHGIKGGAQRGDGAAGAVLPRRGAQPGQEHTPVQLLALRRKPGGGRGRGRDHEEDNHRRGGALKNGTDIRQDEVHPGEADAVLRRLLARAYRQELRRGDRRDGHRRAHILGRLRGMHGFQQLHNRV